MNPLTTGPGWVAFSTFVVLFAGYCVASERARYRERRRGTVRVLLAGTVASSLGLILLLGYQVSSVLFG